MAHVQSGNPRHGLLVTASILLVMFVWTPYGFSLPGFLQAVVGDAKVQAQVAGLVGDALGFIGYAVSLGGVESLICTPANMTHESFSAEDRAAAQIPDGLLRLAVGIEDSRDNIDLLAAGLAAASPTTTN